MGEYTGMKNNKLIDWIDSVIQKKLKINEIHITDLIGETTDKKLLYDKAIVAYADLIEICIKKDQIKHYLPILVLHLECSENLNLTVKLKDLWTEFDSTPPSLYLVDKKTLSNTERVEEYKQPISFSPLSEFKKDCVFYYRCFRNLEGQKNNWEYNRAVYFEYFGKEHILD